MTVSYQLTEEDFIHYHKWAFKRQLLGGLGIAYQVALVITWIFTTGQKGFEHLIAALVLLLVFAVLYFSIDYFYGKYRMRKVLQSHPSSLLPKTCTITHDGLAFNTEANLLIWESIQSIERNQGFLILTQMDKNVILIPVRAFEQPLDAVNFFSKVTHAIEHDPKHSSVRAKTVKNRPAIWLIVLCIIPGVGALAGLWLIYTGLMVYKKNWVIALGVASIVITVLAYSLKMKSNGGENYWRTDPTQLQLKHLVKEIEYYKVEKGTYPRSLDQLNMPDFSYTDPFAFSPDGKPLPYTYEQVQDGYRLFSVGEDGKPHTADDLFPEINQTPYSSFGLKK